MYIDIGIVYKWISEVKDPSQSLFGLIPLMASCSVGQLGALNAESFCERMLSCANLVMTDGNTLLSDDELEMLVILRMNRNFMEFMHKNYSHLALENFVSGVGI